MGISTSTGTLIAGQSRTFNLSPASAVTLTLSPNVRVTITETPATVAATGLGGNASRVHEPRLPGTFTYGPYPMGGSVLVENESNSGSSVAWVRSDSIVAESADGAQSLVDGAGNVYTGIKTNGGAQKGDLLHRFTSAAALSAVSGGILSDSASVTFEGSPTVKLTSPSAGTTSGLQITGLAVPTRTSSLILLCYIPDYSKVDGVLVYMSQGATLTPNYVSYSGYSLVNDSHKYNGWHAIEISQDMWSVVGTGVAYDGTTAKVLRVDVSPRAGRTAEVYFAAAYLNTGNTPSIIFTWDDGRASQYNNVFRISSKYSIPMTCYTVPPYGGTHFSVEQAREIERFGGAICNHAMSPLGTNDDSYYEIGLSAYSSQVFASRDWLNAAGFRGAAHHSYVEGAYDQILVETLSAGGIKTARCISGNGTSGAQSMTEAWGVMRRMALKGGDQLNSGRSLASIKLEVDRAVRDGRSLIVTGHDVFTAAEGGAGALAWLDTDLDALMDYVATYRAKGQVQTPNLVDWYNSLALAT